MPAFRVNRSHLVNGACLKGVDLDGLLLARKVAEGTPRAQRAAPNSPEAILPPLFRVRGPRTMKTLKAPSGSRSPTARSRSERKEASQWGQGSGMNVLCILMVCFRVL